MARKKTNKASSGKAIEGIKAKPTPMYSQSIEHPNGDVYPPTSPSAGEVKKITQFATDAKFKDLLSDGYTDEGKHKVETLKFKGETYRWMYTELGKADLATIREMRAHENYNRIALHVLSLAKRMTNLAKNPQVAIVEEDVEKLLDFVTDNVSAAKTALVQRATGKKDEDGEEEAFALF